MTSGQRRRYADILADRVFAPQPTKEDIRILMAEMTRLETDNRRLSVALDAATAAAADMAFVKLTDTRPQVKS